MLARSFVRDAGLLVAVLSLGAACDSSHKPEADPARVQTLAKAMDKNSPGIGVGRPCLPEELVGGATMTQLALLKLADNHINPGPEREPWTNPPELDSPAVHEILDENVDETTKRQAAYELLSAPFFVVYRADLVDAPMAIKVKELKRGTVGYRVIRYNQKGGLDCDNVLMVQNSKGKSDEAIVKSNLAVMDPEVSAGLRDDLKAELLKRVAALGRKDAFDPPPEHVNAGSGD
jgi:hypothetical protein